MAIFKYTTVSKKGQFHVGYISAKSKHLAIKKIKYNHNLIISIIPDWSFINRICLDDIIQLFVHISFQLKCGTSFYKALMNYLNIIDNPKMREIVAHLADELQNGNSLFNTMKEEQKYFGNIIPELLQVACVSGNLEKTIDNIIKYLTMQKRLREKIKKILLYPTFVLVISILSCFFCLVFLAPQVKEISEDMFPNDIPYITRFCFALIPDSSSEWWLLKIILLLSVICCLFAHKVREFILTYITKIPYIRRYICDIFEWYFCSIADITFNSGLKIIQFINIISSISFTKKRVECIKKYILSGISFSVALQEFDFLSKHTLLAIKVGEDGTKLGETFQQLARAKDQQIKLILSKASVKIGVFITLFTSCILIFLILGLFMPLYNFSGVLNE